MDDSPTPSPPQPQNESTITPVRPFLKPTSKSTSILCSQTNKQALFSKGRMSSETEDIKKPKQRMTPRSKSVSYKQDSVCCDQLSLPNPARASTTQPGPRQAGCVPGRKLCSAKR